MVGSAPQFQALHSIPESSPLKLKANIKQKTFVLYENIYIVSSILKTGVECQSTDERILSLPVIVLGLTRSNMKNRQWSNQKDIKKGS